MRKAKDQILTSIDPKMEMEEFRSMVVPSRNSSMIIRPKFVRGYQTQN